ncbi:ABC transporter ATP-binding protein [Azospirillum sp. SYSU D00513]|uniref:ABC transporter ATP-binding protein n=1 Tax=Azospirillum sp. SYSU D00513 TaxID=2812561 RepID=UPI001A976CA3|nr:ABC transporter ATP-binding protein [Azospirillum sp. SYSU D00513]
MSRSDSAASSIVDLDGIHLKLDSGAGPVNILRGLNLRIAAGERVGVVGPSGSGKSTMMMIMAGLERPTGGTVRIADQDLGRLDEDGLARFRRDHVGIVFQSFHLVPTMTAVENVAIPLEFAGVPDAFERARAGLEAVGLAHRITHYPGQLSGGEQQRVALARAFVTEPRLLLADEPTGNLDIDTGNSIVKLLFDLAERRGTTLVLITHDPSLAARCDRTVRVTDGRIVEDSRNARPVAVAGE